MHVGEAARAARIQMLAGARAVGDRSLDLNRLGQVRAHRCGADDRADVPTARAWPPTGVGCLATTLTHDPTLSLLLQEKVKRKNQDMLMGQLADALGDPDPGSEAS